MWEDILKKDTILDLIGKFIFIETKERKDELTEKTKKSERIIFPRYHHKDNKIIFDNIFTEEIYKSLKGTKSAKF